MRNWPLESPMLSSSAPAEGAAPLRSSVAGGIVKIEEQGIAGAQEPVHLTGAVERKAQPFPGGL